ncbi:molybdopterin-dependent oxidoreductase [Sorangium sp. So ce321]|uniref:molybdopterin-dependent oxidoreductase n=1 Tax=Sorangium sp. So ce321 TaxID=3133300 RepID=UPI003F639662
MWHGDWPAGRPTAPTRSDLPSACCLCTHNCGIRIDVESGRIAAIRADAQNPNTRGYICQKGYSLAHYVDHAQRVTHPLRRTPGGSFERISWSQAVREIGARLRSLRDRYSPRSIALAGCGGQGNHLDAAYALAFLQGLGSPNWFPALAQEKTQHPLVDRWMVRAPPTAYLVPDAEQSRTVVMLGTNPWLSHRGRRPRDLIRALQDDPGRTLVVVDPRRTETAARADIYLPIKPGADCYFLLALCADIVQRGLHDLDFIRQRTRGFEEISAVLRRLDVAALAARCRLRREDVGRVAWALATARPASLFFDLGVEQTPFSTLNAYLIRLLSAITGNLGRRGGNVYTAGPLASRLDLLDALPQPRARVSSIEAIPVLGPIGAFSPNLLPEEISVDGEARIRALIVEGSNPLLTYAGTDRLRAAFEALDLLVVIDPAFTETSRMADYVLPTPVAYEKWEWSAFPNGYPGIYAQVRPPVVAPPPEALPEAEIYYRLAVETGLVPRPSRAERALARSAASGGAALLFQALAGARGALQVGALGGALRAGALRAGVLGGALSSVVFSSYRLIGPGLPSPSLSSLWLLSHLFALTNRNDVLRSLPPGEKPAQPWELGARLFQRLLENPGGVEIARLDPAKNLETYCTFRDGRVRLALPEMLREVDRALRAVPAELGDFPFTLYTGERLWWNSNTIHRDPAWRKGKGPHCVLRIHPDDAKAVGVQSGDRVRVETHAGHLEVPCGLDDRLQIGHVSLPHGFGQLYPDPATGALREDGVNVNILTDAKDRDPFTGVPHHKHVPCRLRRAVEQSER